MLKFWQITILLFFAQTPLHAQVETKFEWKPLDIKKSIFSQDLVMLDSERDEYSSNLAGYAVNSISQSLASDESLAKGRRILALAMQLSPRNKQALVAQFQLSKGIIPEKSNGDYSPDVLARLLLTRSQLLLQQPEGENHLLAKFLIHIAAEIDPRNQDAVYASELSRIDNGQLNWDEVTNDKTADAIVPAEDDGSD
ncbi:MAG: hypothetical protein ACSHX7_04005 [Luteolibacter sp.]